MSKTLTKSSGIRMPTKLYDWIDRLAAKKSITRSQCVCSLVKIAGKSLSSKKPWTVNAAWAGYSCSSIIITLSLVGLIQQALNV